MKQNLLGDNDMEADDHFMDIADAMQIVLDLAAVQLGRATQRALDALSPLGEKKKLLAISTVEDFAVNQLGDD